MGCVGSGVITSVHEPAVAYGRRPLANTRALLSIPCASIFPGATWSVRQFKASFSLNRVALVCTTVRTSCTREPTPEVVTAKERIILRGCTDPVELNIIG